MKEKIASLRERYSSDVRFRVNASLHWNFWLNIAYALLQLGLGYKHHTVWYYSLAGYHAILAFMRFFLMRYSSKHEIREDVKKEWKLYRFCGIMLFGLNVTLAGFVYYIMWQGRAFVHHEITVIALAAYTFYMFTMSVISFNKYRKLKSPVYTAGRMIGLATALVSMLTLEKAMLATFGAADGEEFRLIMTGATGAGVTVLVLGMAIYMVVVANRRLKGFKVKE
ncbi:MAG: hypothetical protein J6A73_03115 [Lachnospiraceae bacterium]|nr:hypothetical protein [Lachnospiraceae bacterium]